MVNYSFFKLCLQFKERGFIMWLFYAIGSAFFAGITAILSKVGIQNVNSNLATALRTVVVVIFAWIMVFIVGTQNQLSQLTAQNIIFLVLSGLATGASWICYFRALQIGNINKVVPIDKSSTILTMILAFLFFHEPISGKMLLGMLLLIVGTYLMIEKKDVTNSANEKNYWFILALGSALFASLQAILGKAGMQNIDSNLGTAIRTIVVLIMAWIIVLATGKQKEITKLTNRNWLFLVLSGIATGSSWLCYYRALQEGPASVVVPIDKLSILITIGFSYFVFKEKLTKKALIGLILIVVGTLVLI